MNVPNPVNTLFGEWVSVDTLPFEPKVLRKTLDDGNAGIIANTGVSVSCCPLTEDAENTGKILFITVPFWKPELLCSAAHADLLKAVGYLSQGESEDAGALFFRRCIYEPMNLADALWEKQCRFNENYSGFRMMDADIHLALQEFFPDMSMIQRIRKYVTGNRRALLRDAADFEAKAGNNLKEYRKILTSSHLADLDDAAYLAAFRHDFAELKMLYRELLNYLKEMAMLPELFGCRNYLLKGGTYRDIAGICRLVSVEEIEKKNWSFKPEDYV